jgi:hypothetical protein
MIPMKKVEADVRVNGKRDLLRFESEEAFDNWLANTDGVELIDWWYVN